MLAVRDQRGRIDDADVGKQPQTTRVARSTLNRQERTGRCNVVGVGRHRVGGAATLNKLSGSSLALAEAWPPVNLLAVSFEGLGECFGPGDVARRVHADVHGRIAMTGVFGTKQLVERRDAVRLGWRYLQNIADVVEPTSTDPTDVGLERMECRKQQVATIVLARHATANEPLGLVDNDSSVRRENGVDRNALGVSRVVDSQVKISHAVLLALVFHAVRR